MANKTELNRGGVVDVKVARYEVFVREFVTWPLSV